jgi:hypothetical protein
LNGSDRRVDRGPIFATAPDSLNLPPWYPVSPTRHRSHPSTSAVTTEALQSEEAALTSVARAQSTRDNKVYITEIAMKSTKFSFKAKEVKFSAILNYLF